MCKVKIWHCHPSRTLKWTKIGHLVTKWATPGHKKKPDQWKVWFGLFALFWPGEEKHRLIVMILTWLFSTCMSSLPPIHLPEADKHHPDTLRGGAQAEEVGQQVHHQASNFPSLPVAFSNSRSLPVKRECDFQFPFPFSGAKKPFALTPGPYWSEQITICWLLNPSALIPQYSNDNN